MRFLLKFNLPLETTSVFFIRKIMNHRFKPRRLAAVRCPYASMTTLALGSATAQPIPKEGNYDYASRSSGTSIGIQFSKTHGTYTLERVGNTRINPPDVAFRALAYHCMGQGSTIDSKSSNSYYCQVADNDGDKFMLCGVCEGPKRQQNVIEKNEINPVFAANAACHTPLNP